MARPPMQCLLDLDGVLVDFCGAVETRFGITIDRWDFDDNLPVSKTAFWESCDESFWVSLNWTPDGQQILKMVQEAFCRDNVCLLTSPCLTVGCLEGKMRWIERYLPEYKRRYLIGPAKHFCASPNRVLVDDRDENVQGFRSQGGRAVLVPRPWNSLKDIPTLLHVEYWLEIIKEVEAICG